MTTKELIKKTYDVVSKVLKVDSIDFEECVDYTTGDEQMSLTIFYTKDSLPLNFTVHVYSWNEDRGKYTVNALLKELELELETFRKNRIKSLDVND